MPHGLSGGFLSYGILFRRKTMFIKDISKRLWQDISRDFLTQIWSPFFRCFGVSQITISHSLMVICETTKPNWSLEKVSLQHKFSSTQVLRTLSGTKLLLFRVWEEYRCKMATKSPRNRLLNRSSKSQENRKCKRVFIVIFYSSSILSHTKMHCGKCVTVVDGHTRCLVACCMSRTCYRFTHRNLFQITNLGRWCPQSSTRQEQNISPFTITTGSTVTP